MNPGEVPIHERALLEAGWRKTRSGRFQIESKPRLQISADLSPGEWIRVTSTEIGIGKRSFLDETAAPSGPFKLLPATGHSVIVVADLPRMTGDETAARSLDWIDGDRLGRTDPVAIWAGDLMAAIAGGGPERNGVPPLPPAEALLQTLSSRGWAAFEKEGEVHVNLQGNGYFQQVFLRANDRGGLRLETVLGAWEAPGADTLRAILTLAGEANERLRLARVVRRMEGTKTQILAQVDLGRLPIGDEASWLHIALDSLRAAGNFLALEVPLLFEDAVVAGWVLNHGNSFNGVSFKKEQKR